MRIKKVKGLEDTETEHKEGRNQRKPETRKIMEKIEDR